MAFRLRALRIQLATGDGPYGTRMVFGPGLNVIRGDNTSGKSTCLMALIYALGLEGMISASRTPPFTPAMTTELFTPALTMTPVLESSVTVEVENGEGEVLTVQRWVKHARYRPNLVTIWDAPMLSVPTGAEGQDLFVRESGAAQHDLGFHARLASFLGWTLPEVGRTDGTQGPLYLECIFPLLSVEQKRGWGGVLQHLPYYLRIPDMARRAVEFVLSLDAYAIAQRRRQLEQSEADVKSSWRFEVTTFDRVASDVGGRTQGIPPFALATWPPTSLPQVVVFEDNEWRSLDDVLLGLRQRLEALDRTAEPQPDEDQAPALTIRMAELEQVISATTNAGLVLLEDIGRDEAQSASIEARIAALQQDQQRYRDMRTLRRLGANRSEDLLRGECPTCHQDLPEALIGLVEGAGVMSLDDNLQFSAEELRTFRTLKAELDVDLRAKRLRLEAVRRRAADLRQELRAVRRTLVSPTPNSSAATEQQRIRLRDRIERLAAVSTGFATMTARLEELASDLATIAAEIESLRGLQISEQDESKLASLEQRLRAQLTEFGFSSLPINDVGISRVKYTPEHQGFDLGSDVSASDMIRAIWSYILGLLEIARTHATNHPGFVMLDEPRQQDTDPRSFAEFLRRASRSLDFDQQVLCATSETTANLHNWLKGIPHSYIEIPAKVLQPLA
jgi:hypothetical protein